MQWWLGCVRIMHMADPKSFIPWLIALWKWSCPGYETPNQTCNLNKFPFFKKFWRIQQAGKGGYYITLFLVLLDL